MIKFLNSPQMQYRHKILTSQLEKEKQFRFDHISIGYVVTTELFFLFKLGCSNLTPVTLWLSDKFRDT